MRSSKHAIVRITALTEAEYKSEFEATKDTSYLTWWASYGVPFAWILNITDSVI